MIEFNYVRAPFTDEQVENLNGYQNGGPIHPFTCGSGNRTDDKHLDGEGILVATNKGWHCPYCMYTQDWAHTFMADGTWTKFVDHFNELIVKAKK